MTTKTLKPLSSSPIAQQLGTTDPPVTLCNQCCAVRVESKGDVCLPCSSVMENYARLRAEAAKVKRVGLVLMIACVVIMLGAFVAAFAWK